LRSIGRRGPSQYDLLEGCKIGRWVYYRLVESRSFGSALRALVASLPDPDGTFAEDQSRLDGRMALRRDGRCQIGIQTPELRT
jgi:hypothetical protein